MERLQGLAASETAASWTLELLHAPGWTEHRARDVDVFPQCYVHGA